MSYVEGGKCGKCGAPYYVPQVWLGTGPPTTHPVCGCWNMRKTVTATTTEADLEKFIKKTQEQIDEGTP